MNQMTLMLMVQRMMHRMTSTRFALWHCSSCWEEEGWAVEVTAAEVTAKEAAAMVGKAVATEGLMAPAEELLAAVAVVVRAAESKQTVGS